MKIIQDILPIRTMVSKDWKQIHEGFVITSSTDWHIPKENKFSEQIIGYLLNTQLQLVDYAKYDEFCFDVMLRIQPPIFYHPKGIKIITEYGETWIRLEVYMPNTQCFAQVDKHEALFDRDDFDGKKFYEDILPIVQPIANGTRTFREEEFPL